MTAGRAVVGTIAAKNHLSMVRVLAASLAERHPDLPFALLLLDDPDGLFDPRSEPFEVISVSDLGLPHPERFLFQYGRGEVASALKPNLLRLLLDRGHDHVLFLDPDMLVLDRLDSVLDALGRHQVVLSPHLLTPASGDGGADRELAILTAGAANGGMLGVSGGSSARAFLDWWEDRLYTHCRLSVAEGLQHDQRWLDLAPAMFDGVHLLRDPRCNVAYWNLPERSDQSFALVHFSGFDPARHDRVTRHDGRLTPEAFGAPDLFRSYSELLNAAGFRRSRHWAYSHDFFDDGTVVPAVARRALLDLGDEAGRFGDPFRSDGSGSFREWLRQPVDAPGGGEAVSRLWDTAYRSRPDVRLAYPDHLGADRGGFLEWTRTTGARELGVPAELR
jgi:hypothetical protein